MASQNAQAIYIAMLQAEYLMSAAELDTSVARAATLCGAMLLLCVLYIVFENDQKYSGTRKTRECH